jgi:hypothetical protein
VIGIELESLRAAETLPAVDLEHQRDVAGELAQRVERISRVAAPR